MNFKQMADRDNKFIKFVQSAIKEYSVDLSGREAVLAEKEIEAEENIISDEDEIDMSGAGGPDDDR